MQGGPCHARTFPQEPLKTILNGIDFLTFGLDLLGVDCVFGNHSSARSFVLHQLVAPFLVLVIFFCVMVKKHWRPSTAIISEFSNSAGVVFMAFSISIVDSAMTPLLCKTQPNGNGQTLRSSPSVICFTWSENHPFRGTIFHQTSNWVCPHLPTSRSARDEQWCCFACCRHPFYRIWLRVLRGRPLGRWALA